MSRTWKDLASFLGAELHHSTAYHPQSQGIAERVNRTLKTSLKARGSPSEWHDNLPWTMLALRNSSREDLEDLSSNEIVFGEPLRLLGEFFVASNHESITSSGATPSFVQSIAQKVASLPPSTIG